MSILEQKKYRFKDPTKSMSGWLDLPISQVKILDSETKRNAINITDEVSTYMLKLGNEPDWALFRVREHVKRKIPKMVKKIDKIKNSEKKVSQKLINVGYACSTSNALSRTLGHIEKVKERVNYLMKIPNLIPKPEIAEIDHIRDSTGEDEGKKGVILENEQSMVVSENENESLSEGKIRIGGEEKSSFERMHEVIENERIPEEETEGENEDGEERVSQNVEIKSENDKSIDSSEQETQLDDRSDVPEENSQKVEVVTEKIDPNIESNESKDSEESENIESDGKDEKVISEDSENSQEVPESPEMKEKEKEEGEKGENIGGSGHIEVKEEKKDE